MTFDGYRNLEWIAHNAARQYPLTVTACGESTDSLFKLPVDVLAGVYIYLPWDRDINPTRFFISKIDNYPSQLSIFIGYQPPTGAAVEVAEATVGRGGFSAVQIIPLVPATGWEDINGSVVINQLPSGDLTPMGTYAFNLSDTQLEADCIRPSAQALSGLIVTDGNQESIIATGLVNIRAGANMQVRVEQVGNQYDVYLDAIDGSGLNGDCPCGDQLTDPIRTINLVQPSADGNIDLVGAKCLEVVNGSAAISLNNPCSDPCCGCPEAEALTAAIAPLADNIRDTGSFARRLTDLTTDIRDVIDRADFANAPSTVTETTTTSITIGTTTTVVGTTTTTIPGTTTTAGGTTTTAATCDDAAVDFGASPSVTHPAVPVKSSQPKYAAFVGMTYKIDVLYQAYGWFSIDLFTLSNFSQLVDFQYRETDGTFFVLYLDTGLQYVMVEGKLPPSITWDGSVTHQESLQNLIYTAVPAAGSIIPRMASNFSGNEILVTLGTAPAAPASLSKVIRYNTTTHAFEEIPSGANPSTYVCGLRNISLSLDGTQWMLVANDLQGGNQRSLIHFADPADFGNTIENYGIIDTPAYDSFPFITGYPGLYWFSLNGNLALQSSTLHATSDLVYDNMFLAFQATSGDQMVMYVNASNNDLVVQDASRTNKTSIHAIQTAGAGLYERLQCGQLQTSLNITGAAPTTTTSLPTTTTAPGATTTTAGPTTTTGAPTTTTAVADPLVPAAAPLDAPAESVYPVHYGSHNNIRVVFDVNRWLNIDLTTLSGFYSLIDFTYDAVTGKYYVLYRDSAAVTANVQVAIATLDPVVTVNLSGGTAVTFNTPTYRALPEITPSWTVGMRLLGDFNNNQILILDAAPATPTLTSNTVYKWDLGVDSVAWKFTQGNLVNLDLSADKLRYLYTIHSPTSPGASNYVAAYLAARASTIVAAPTFIENFPFSSFGPSNQIVGLAGNCWGNGGQWATNREHVPDHPVLGPLPGNYTVQPLYYPDSVSHSYIKNNGSPALIVVSNANNKRYYADFNHTSTLTINELSGVIVKRIQTGALTSTLDTPGVTTTTVAATTTTLGATTTTAGASTTTLGSTLFVCPNFIYGDVTSPGNLYRFGALSTAPNALLSGISAARHVTIDATNQLIISSGGGSSVEVRDFNNTLIRTWSGLTDVKGVVADPANNRFFVADRIGLHVCDNTVPSPAAPTSLIVLPDLVTAVDTCLLHGRVVFASAYAVYSYTVGDTIGSMLQLMTIPRPGAGGDPNSVTHMNLLGSDYELLVTTSDARIYRSGSYERGLTGGSEFAPAFPGAGGSRVNAVAFAAQTTLNDPAIYILSTGVSPASYENLLQTTRLSTTVQQKFAASGDSITGCHAADPTLYLALPNNFKQPHLAERFGVDPDDLNVYSEVRVYGNTSYAQSTGSSFSLADYELDGGHVMSYGQFSGMLRHYDVASGGQVNPNAYRQYNSAIRGEASTGYSVSYTHPGERAVLGTTGNASVYSTEALTSDGFLPATYSYDVTDADTYLASGEDVGGVAFFPGMLINNGLSASSYHLYGSFATYTVEILPTTDLGSGTPTNARVTVAPTIASGTLAGRSWLVNVPGNTITAGLPNAEGRETTLSNPSQIGGTAFYSINAALSGNNMLGPDGVAPAGISNSANFSAGSISNSCGFVLEVKRAFQNTSKLDSMNNAVPVSGYYASAGILDAASSINVGGPAGKRVALTVSPDINLVPGGPLPRQYDQEVGTVLALWGSPEPKWNGLVIVDPVHLPPNEEDLLVYADDTVGTDPIGTKAPKFFAVAGGIHGPRLRCRSTQQFTVSWSGETRYPIRHELSLGFDGHDATGGIELLFAGSSIGGNDSFKAVRVETTETEVATNVFQLHAKVTYGSRTVSGFTAGTQFATLLLGEAITTVFAPTPVYAPAWIRVWAETDFSLFTPWSMGAMCLNTMAEKKFTLPAGSTYGHRLRYGFFHDAAAGDGWISELSARAKHANHPKLIGDIGYAI